jgi:hypothetical protein
MGVKPKFQMDEWMPRPSKVFQEFMKKTCQDQTLKMRATAVSKNIFDVVLFHPETKERLDKLAVQEGYADASDDAEKICENILDDSGDLEDEEKEVPPLDIKQEDQNILAKVEKLLMETQDEDALQELLFQMYGYPKSARFLKDIPNTQQVKPPKRKALCNKKISAVPSKSDDEKLQTLKSVMPSKLSYIHKHPKIEWRQDEIIAYLTISAVDCVDYSLSADNSTLKICIKYETSYERAVVHLYGVIEPKYISHEKAGENIIVRLLKSIALQWPRLSKLDEPNRFITFNHDPLPSYLSGNVDESKYKHTLPAGCDDDSVNGELGDEDEDESTPL